MPGRIEQIAKDTAKTLRCEARMENIRLVPPTINDPMMAGFAEGASRKDSGPGQFHLSGADHGRRRFRVFHAGGSGRGSASGNRQRACGAVWPNHSGKFCVDESMLIKGAMIYAQVAMDFNAGQA